MAYTEPDFPLLVWSPGFVETGVAVSNIITEEVVLENRVRLIATDKDSLITEIHCKYLELDLKTNIISSDQTILIQGKDVTMYGSGIVVDLNTRQMTLNEHVQTIYKKIDA